MGTCYRDVNTLQPIAIWNRQALRLLEQIEPFLRSYKRDRARLVLCDYVPLTPRNGKYTADVLAQRQQFENTLLALRASSARKAAAVGFPA